jgi:microcystin-dependent protein
MTARMMTTGATPMSGPLKHSTGTAAAPSMTFSGATNVGFFKTASGIGVSINGTQVAEFTTVSPFVPVGAIVDWPAVVLPSGWLACQGQSLLRASYPALFLAIGAYYGPAVDELHFRLPNLQGNVTAGLYQSGTGYLTGADTLGNLLGAETVLLLQTHLPNHTLPNTLGVSRTGSVALSGATTGVVNSGSGGSANMTGGGGALKQDNITLTDTQAWSVTGSVTLGGGNTVHPNVQPTIILNKIIYTGVA